MSSHQRSHSMKSLFNQLDHIFFHTYARCKLCLWWRKLCPLLPWRQSQNTNLKCVFLTPLSGAAVPDDTSNIFQLNELPRARVAPPARFRSGCCVKRVCDLQPIERKPLVLFSFLMLFSIDLMLLSCTFPGLLT